MSPALVLTLFLVSGALLVANKQIESGKRKSKQKARLTRRVKEILANAPNTQLEIVDHSVQGDGALAEAIVFYRKWHESRKSDDRMLIALQAQIRHWRLSRTQLQLLGDKIPEDEWKRILDFVAPIS